MNHFKRFALRAMFAFVLLLPIISGPMTQAALACGGSPGTC